MTFATGGRFSNYPQGFAYGISVRGIPLLQCQPGQVYWLNNSTVLNPGQKPGSDGNSGTFLAPFATLNYAASRCVAGRGDIIMVGTGHAESITSATALTIANSGTAVIGLGAGDLRPTFTLTTATTATINIKAADVSFQNCVFLGGFLNIAALFTLTAANNFAVDNCEIRDSSSTLTILNVIATDATANHADGLALTRNLIISKSAAGAVTLLAPGANQDRWRIEDNTYIAATTAANAVMVLGAHVMTAFRVINNNWYLTNATGTATGYLITTSASTDTGIVQGNIDRALPSTPLLCTTGSGLSFGFGNYHSDAADTQGYLVPAADS